MKEKYNDVSELYADYKNEHKYCPKCGSQSIETTLAGYIADPNHPEEYKDRNRVTCINCGFTGITHNLVGYKPTNNPNAKIITSEKIDNRRILSNPTAYVVRNKKTNGLYMIVDKATNTTNANDGQKMIIYRNSEGMIFVREINEFCQKFLFEYNV